MSVFGLPGAPGEGITIFFGPPKRRDEYEDDSGMDSEEDDPVERQRKKRLAKKTKKAVGRPKAAVERRLAEGGASSWHYLFQAASSPYKRLIYGKDWSTASSAALNRVLSSNGLTVNKAASLWLQSTNKPLTSIPAGPQRTLMAALQTGGDDEEEDDEEEEEEGGARAASGDAESLLACVALSHAAEAMPVFAADRAAAAFDSVVNPTHVFETPYHWEIAAEEREDMWARRAHVANQQLAPSLKAAANAIRNALRTGDDGALRAVLASISFPNL